MAGVQRMVFFRSAPPYLQEIAQQHNLTLVEICNNSSKARVEAIISKYYQDNNIDGQDEINERRKQRKEEEKERKTETEIGVGSSRSISY